ncbi:MAG TPA: dihydrodipicolinate synthase family protein [Gemmatimonadales bacterium]|jgi:4-hydroxy-2-oxoglutarate aldolase|nr:dihydrodipicolinate synthase family protein [Gemmatimonadales bacterium]
MRDKLRGLLVPIVTPFDPVSGDVAPVSLRANARALLEAGVDGILAAGSTGEAAMLDEREFQQLVEWLRDVVPDERWLLAGTGRESTRATIAACKVAAEAGADAVLVRPPAYYGGGLSVTALVAHFRHVADASPVPVLLYNIPKYTHVALHEAVLAALAEHPNVVGAKDSSGDLKNFAAYRAAAPSWALLMGSGSHFYPALELGGVGAILAVANCAAGLAVRLARAFAGGDRAQAGATQEVLTPLNKLVVGELGVPGVKAAVDLVGMVGGPVRPPLADLDAPARARVQAALVAAGLEVQEPSGRALG